VRVVRTVQRLAADLQQLLAFPAIAAEQRHGDAQLARLARDEPGLRVVTGDVDRVRLLRLDRGQLGAEVLVAGLVGLLGDDRAAQLLERGAEELGEAGGVVALQVLEDRRLLDTQRVVRELGDRAAQFAYNTLG